MIFKVVSSHVCDTKFILLHTQFNFFFHFSHHPVSLSFIWPVRVSLQVIVPRSDWPRCDGYFAFLACVQSWRFLSTSAVRALWIKKCLYFYWNPLLGFLKVNSNYRPSLTEPTPLANCYIYNNNSWFVFLFQSLTATKGSTELWRVLQKLYLLPAVSAADHPRNLFLISDGHVTEEDTTLHLIRTNCQTDRLFTFGVG